MFQVVEVMEEKQQQFKHYVKNEDGKCVKNESELHEICQPNLRAILIQNITKYYKLKMRSERMNSSLRVPLTAVKIKISFSTLRVMSKIFVKT